MGEQVDQLISSLLFRLRDQQGVIHSRPFVLEILSRCQQIYNEGFGLALREIPFTPLQLRQWYSLTPDMGMTSLIHVIHQNRDLTKATLDDLKSIDRKWHRAVGSRLECFVPLGYTSFILWPALPHDDECTLIGPALTPTLLSEQNNLTISTERTPLFIQLVELILNNRQNDPTAFTVIMQNFQRFLPSELQKESRRGSVMEEEPYT